MDKLKNPNDSDYFYYVCPCGHIEIATIVKFDDKQVGYIILGPFSAPPDNAKAKARLEHFIERFNLDYNEVKKLYGGAEPFSEYKFNSIKVIITSIVEYMQLKEYIVADDDFFSGYMKEFIKNNLDQDLSVEQLCHEFGMSTTLLYKIFKTNANVTPQQFVKQMRLKRACKLLRTTNLQMQKICSMVGICDYNYFIKVFKGSFGMTPLQYRNAPEDKLPKL